MRNGGFKDWRVPCIVDWAHDIMGLPYEWIGRKLFNKTSVWAYYQHKKWRSFSEKLWQITHMDARQAIAGAIADELGWDLNDETMLIIDKILSRLWLFGFKVVELE